MGRELHLLAHPRTDLIDALHDDAVKTAYERYPGAAAMQAAWEDHVAERAKAGETVRASTRKAWLQEQYAIDNSREAYSRVADAHLELGLEPPGLAPIVERAVELGMRSRGAARSAAAP